MRTCILCELEKLLSEFYQVKTDKSGYSGICIECKKKDRNHKEIIITRG